MFEVGEVVSGFTIDAFLGGGASADVFRAHRHGRDEPLALKVLHPDAADHARVRERFEREFNIASSLNHRHIVAMYDHGEIPPPRGSVGPRNRPSMWLTMQYIPGPSASVLVPGRNEEPAVSTILRVAAQIGSALDYAHRCEIIHRDVKPANILLSRPVGADRPPDPDVDAYLTDFGIAQFLDDTRPLARNGRVQGSIGYASPELLQAQRLSAGTDNYAFACSLVELLTGEPPYPRHTAFAIARAHINAEPPRLTRRRPWLPSAADSIFAKALAKKPEDRYPTCTELVDLLTRLMRDVPVPEPRTGPRWWRPRI